jgi:hypothetical protein
LFDEFGGPFALGDDFFRRASVPQGGFIGFVVQRRSGESIPSNCSSSISAGIER